MCSLVARTRESCSLIADACLSPLERDPTQSLAPSPGPSAVLSGPLTRFLAAFLTSDSLALRTRLAKGLATGISADKDVDGERGLGLQMLMEKQEKKEEEEEEEQRVSERANY